MAKKVTLVEDAPWRAIPGGKKPVPRIHHSPILRTDPQNPSSAYALAAMKRPDPIGEGFATEARIESAGPDCIVPGQIPPIRLLGLKVWPLTGIDLKFLEPVGRELQTIGKVRTVKVSNVSLGASEQDIKEFFSFSGDIQYVEMHSGDEWSQVAYVTFKDPQAVETALLLSGATIVDLSVIIMPATDYQLPAAASDPPAYEDAKPAGGSESAVQKAEDVVSSMLAKGFILGKDAVNKAKSFDEKHRFTSTATAKVASLDRKIGLSEKITMGTSAVNEKVREMDQKFQVSDKTKSAFAAAEQKVSSAGSAVMKNRYVFTGASWVTGAFSKVAKAASDVGNKTKEKVAAGGPNKGT